MFALASAGLSPFQVLALIIVAAMLVLALAIIAADHRKASAEAARQAEDDELSRYEPTGPVADPDIQTRWPR